MGNIYESPEDHTQITCLIDWQHTSVSPLFIQVRWPIFLKPPPAYREGVDLPALPANFEELDCDDKELALAEKDEAVCAKAYEIQTYLNNRPAYYALWKFDDRLREIFSRIGDRWDDSIVPLREVVLVIYENWDEMGLSVPCPVSFTPEDVAAHEHQFSKSAQFHEVQAFAKKYLGTDKEGWISPYVNFAEKEVQNKALLELTIERHEGQLSGEEVRSFWPFPP